MQVKVLVEFLVENCRELFGEETAELCCPAAEESPAPRQSSRGKRRDRGLSQPGARDARTLGVVPGGAGQRASPSEPRLSPGLSWAAASRGTSALFCSAR